MAKVSIDIRTERSRARENKIKQFNNDTVTRLAGSRGSDPDGEDSDDNAWLWYCR